SRRRHTSCYRDWSSDVCSSDLLRLEFLPEFHETNFVMHMTGAPGIGLDESVRVGAATAHALLAVPGVRSVAQVIGRSTLSEDTRSEERRGGKGWRARSSRSQSW